MTPKNKQFLYGISLLFGMIIGVGIFGVPYTIAKAGWVLSIFYFVLISFVLILTHLFYGEVVLRTRESHRFVGFAEKYLGKKYGKPLGVAANVLGFYGALLAYIIVGGQFLHMIFSSFFGGETFWYQIIFFIVMAIAVLVGMKLIAGAEMIMSAFILLIMVLIPLLTFKHFDFSNYVFFDKAYVFLPYGVILFALGGSAAIPEIRDILFAQGEPASGGKEDGRQMKKIIIWGSLIPFIVTAFFAFAIVGATGQGTTEETINGLKAILGNWVVGLGAVFGILAITTSFLILGLNLKEMFILDLKIEKIVLRARDFKFFRNFAFFRNFVGELCAKRICSWFLAVFAPFLIFLIGSRSFITVIGITGSLFGGLVGILMVLMYLKAKKSGDRSPEFDLKIPKFLAYLVMVVYIIGIAYEIFYLF